MYGIRHIMVCVVLLSDVSKGFPRQHQQWLQSAVAGTLAFGGRVLRSGTDVLRHAQRRFMSQEIDRHLLQQSILSLLFAG